VKAPDTKFVVLEARFRPAPGHEGTLFNCYMVVRGEVTARSAPEALRQGKRLVTHPIVEEATSFWARIEAAKVLKNASMARNTYGRNPA
jgi:hypothetical protein